MRIEEQGTAIVVVKTTASVARVVQPPQKKEITISDLKSQPKETAPQEEQKEQEIPQVLQLKAAVETANKLMDLSSYHIKFRIDQDSDRLQVSLIDNDTQEVIREVPSNEMLEISARMKEVISAINKMVGVFVDEIG